MLLMSDSTNLFGTANSRFAIICGLAAFLAACQQAPSSDQANGASVGTEGETPLTEHLPKPEIKQALKAIERAELLTAFAHTADAFAGGHKLPEANKALVGRNFIMRMPFGCDGPDTDGSKSWASWTFNPDTRVLKLTARPEHWGQADWVRQLAGETRYEAAEGFWVQHPWTGSEECPAKPEDTAKHEDGDPSPSLSVRQTVGIAQFFSPDSPRIFQRGARPYSFTLREQPNVEIEQKQYRLIISGRVASYPDGQPIHCWNEASNLQPVCLMTVELSRVAFEEHPHGDILAEWRN